MANHLVLTVRGLPTEANPGGTWYVDAGLGDALHEPIPLIAGQYRQGPFVLVLDETPGAVGDWHLTHDPQGASRACRGGRPPPGWTPRRPPRLAVDVTESGFVRVLAARRDAPGVDVPGPVAQEDRRRCVPADAHDRAELTDVLGDHFGLDVSPVGDQAWDALWARVQATRRLGVGRQP